MEHTSTDAHSETVSLQKTILIVDDEERIVSLLRTYLEQAGFRAVGARNGREALFAARHEKPDLIVLDLMMPEMDGYDFLRLHRKERETPIILLTARVEDENKVLGLELGADHYVTKPFSPRVLLARVHSVLRRAGHTTPEPEVLRVGALMPDRSAHRARIEGEPVDLTPSEFELLAVLMTTPGRAFSRLELLDRVQGTAFVGYERTIDVHIKNLRSKIETDRREPQHIETVWGVGYRLRAG